MWLDSTIDTHELRGNLMVIEVNLAPPPTSRRGAHLVSGITQHHVLMLYVLRLIDFANSFVVAIPVTINGYNCSGYEQYIAHTTIM